MCRCMYLGVLPPSFSLQQANRTNNPEGGVRLIIRHTLENAVFDVQHADTFETVTVRSANASSPLLTVVYGPRLKKERIS